MRYLVPGFSFPLLLSGHVLPFMTGPGAVGLTAMADVRGSGLFVALEWVKDSEGLEPDREGAVRVVDNLKDRGFLTSNAGAYDNVLKIRPPLVFSKDDAEEFLNAFEQTLETLDG